MKNLIQLFSRSSKVGLIRFHLMTKLLAAILLLLACLGSVHANQSIGNVLLAKGVVTASGVQTLRTLAKGSEVFLGETIVTADDSFVVLRMTDASKISLRPKSEVTLEKFSEDEGKEEALFDLVRGGLRAITGTIGKKRPEQFQFETAIATVGIRGTNLYLRLCEGSVCEDEEDSHGSLEKQKSGSATGGNTRNKELRRLGDNDEVIGRTFLDCKPATEIKSGLYVAVYEGKIYVRKGDQVIELEAVEAIFAEDKEILCLGEIPNFIDNDNYLSNNPDDTITLYNFLRNIDEDRRQCEIPGA